MALSREGVYAGFVGNLYLFGGGLRRGSDIRGNWLAASPNTIIRDKLSFSHHVSIIIFIIIQLSYSHHLSHHLAVDKPSFKPSFSHHKKLSLKPLFNHEVHDTWLVLPSVSSNSTRTVWPWFALLAKQKRRWCSTQSRHGGGDNSGDGLDSDAWRWSMVLNNG